MTNATEYERLKKKLENLTSEIDQREGALQHVRAELEKEFGAKSLKSGLALLKRMETKHAKQQDKHDQLVTTFNERWADVISEPDTDE